ncbi:hypothetical protein CRE_17407 [Caenorhabditis remanei]|uniref:F-box associated domain-containing protein n=1 Tax=Caenorhabditis remanei TaxID=31234 RepID=E3N278_CAERE|nr:hypothetical protein CRE_17407 [Caenorhabditis remanei]
MRNETVVKGSLCLWEVPEFLKRRKGNEVDLKMKVTNLELDIYETEDYDHFIRFIDLDVLENVQFFACGNSMAFLDKPVIKSCKNLTVIAVSFDFLSVDQFFSLRNQHLKLENHGLTLHDLQLFVQSWITTGRDIGTRFSWERLQFEYVADNLEYLKTHFGAVETWSNHEYYFSDKVLHGNVITLKMGDDRELVMFCAQIPSERHTYCQWTFEMEVVACTSATANP